MTEGAWLVGRRGQLVVQPGARVQLDCIYSRKRGTPEWTWSNVSKEYPTGGDVSQSDAEKEKHLNSGWATKVKKNWNYRLDLNGAMIEVSI